MEGGTTRARQSGARAPREVPGGTKGAFSPARAFWQQQRLVHLLRPSGQRDVAIKRTEERWKPTPCCMPDSVEPPLELHPARIKRCESADANTGGQRVSWAAELNSDDTRIERCLSSPSPSSRPSTPAEADSNWAASSKLSMQQAHVAGTRRGALFEADHTIPDQSDGHGAGSGIAALTVAQLQADLPMEIKTCSTASMTGTFSHQCKKDAGEDLLNQAEASVGRLELVLHGLHTAWLSEAETTTDELESTKRCRSRGFRGSENASWLLENKTTSARDADAQKTLRSLVHELSPQKPMGGVANCKRASCLCCSPASDRQKIENVHQGAMKDAEQVVCVCWTIWFMGK